MVRPMKPPRMSKNLFSPNSSNPPINSRKINRRSLSNQEDVKYKSKTYESHHRRKAQCRKRDRTIIKGQRKKRRLPERQRFLRDLGIRSFGVVGYAGRSWYKRLSQSLFANLSRSIFTNS